MIPSLNLLTKLKKKRYPTNFTNKARRANLTSYSQAPTIPKHAHRFSALYRCFFFQAFMNFPRFPEFQFFSFSSPITFIFKILCRPHFVSPSREIQAHANIFSYEKMFNFRSNYGHFRVQHYKIPSIKFCDFDIIILALFHRQTLFFLFVVVARISKTHYTNFRPLPIFFAGKKDHVLVQF